MGSRDIRGKNEKKKPKKKDIKAPVASAAGSAPTPKVEVIKKKKQTSPEE
jgi:hypothetical protein